MFCNTHLAKYIALHKLKCVLTYKARTQINKGGKAFFAFSEIQYLITILHTFSSPCGLKHRVYLILEPEAVESTKTARPRSK
jgi:hypothetical protein